MSLCQSVYLGLHYVTVCVCFRQLLGCLWCVCVCVCMPISLACGQAYTDLITPQAECGGGRGGCEADRNRQTRQGERRREHARPAG